MKIIITHLKEYKLIWNICILLLCTGNSFSQISVPSPLIHLAFDTNNPGYESQTTLSGIVSGNYERMTDRFGNSQRAIRFVGAGSGIKWTATVLNSIHTISFWAYVSDPSSIPTGPTPFTPSDKKLEFYNWTDVNNKILRGLARKKATIGFNRYIEKPNGTRVPWYLWSYRPAQFDQKGWYHIFLVQGDRYTRLIMYKPNSQKVYSYNWLGAQDFLTSKYLYVGGYGDKFGYDDAFDDFKFYNSELSDDQIDFCHSAEYPTNRYVKIINKHSGKYINVAGASRDDRAQIIQYTTGAGNDEWRLKYVGNNKEFRIENLHSKKIMVVKDGTTQAGAEIIQYTESGSDNEVWILEYSNINTQFFRLKNKRSGKYLCVAQDATSDNAKLVQENAGMESQFWAFVLSSPIESNNVLEPGLYRFKNKRSGLYLDVQDRSTYANIPLVQKHNAGLLSHTNLWYVTKGEVNGYYLKNLVSNYYMKGPGNDISAASITQGEKVTKDDDIWQLINTGIEGEYYLRNASNYKYAVVMNGSTDEGAGIVQYQNSGADNGIWIPERYYYSDSPIEDGKYTLTNWRSDKFMNVENGSTSDLARIIQYSTADDNGIFEIKQNNFGFVTLKNKKSNKYVLVKDGSLREGENIIQYGNTIPNANGMWLLKKVSTSSATGYEVYNLSSGLNIVVQDGSTANGAPLIQYHAGGDNGIWKFHLLPQILEKTNTLNKIPELYKNKDLYVYTNFKEDNITIEYEFLENKILSVIIADLQGNIVFNTQKTVIENNKVKIDGFNSKLVPNKIYILSISSTDGDINFTTKALMN